MAQACQVAGNTAASTRNVSPMNCGAWKRRRRVVNSGSSACTHAGPLQLNNTKVILVLRALAQHVAGMLWKGCFGRSKSA